MFSRRYAVHLNLPAAPPNNGPPLAQLAFLGLHSELLVSPSDCGSLFIWDYGTARVAAVLPPHAPSASSSGSGGGELTPSAAATCVATHPLLPVLAGGGADSVVRLWSPEAQEACSRELAAAAVGANLQALAELGGLGSESGGATDRLADDPSALFLPGSPCAFQ